MNLRLMVFLLARTPSTRLRRGGNDDVGENVDRGETFLWLPVLCGGGHHDKIAFGHDSRIACLTTGPARILGIPAGTLAPGAAADVTLVDPERRWRVDARAFRSKSRNTPFEGWEMTGRAVAVLVGGRLVYDERPAAAALRSAS